MANLKNGKIAITIHEAYTDEKNAVNLREMNKANIRRIPLPQPQQQQQQQQQLLPLDVTRAPPPTQCGYFATTAVLPKADTCPTSKRLQHKYTISDSSVSPTTASQVLRVQKPTVSNVCSNTTTDTSLGMSAYTQRSLQALLCKHNFRCRWSNSRVCGNNYWWRWSLCLGTSVLLLCMFVFFMWLRGMLQSEATRIDVIETMSTTGRTPSARLTTMITAVTQPNKNAIASNDMVEIKAAVTAWPRITNAWQEQHAAYDDNDKDANYSHREIFLEPNDSTKAAAAVQNLMVLHLLPKDNKLPEENSVPSTSNWLSYTNVSPTIPPLHQWAVSTTTTTTTTMSLNSTQRQLENGCRSTSLLMCHGVLDYDLTSSAAAVVRLSDDERVAFQMLANSNCSARALEFVCAVLEPECQSAGNMLSPCRRICKAILEACSIVVASSDVLTAIFDCGSYPDSSAANECEDPTRRHKYCYENEFACEDQTCIPLQWQCDNIKDCTAGGDEDSCLVCEQQDEFRCRSNEKCIPAVQRCDQQDDCFDGSDEKNCEDYLYDEEIALDTFYPPALATAVLAINDAKVSSTEILNKNNELLQSRSTFNRTSEEGMAKYDISNIMTSETKSQGFVHFRDSKEIMMTSDTENKLKYSTTARVSRTFFNNSFNDSKSNATSSSAAMKTSSSAAQPQILALTEAPLRSASRPPMTTTTKHTAFSGGSSTTCGPHQLRCVSGHCITVQQICDKKIDCPDGADELMCVYKQGIDGVLSATTTSTMRTTTTITTKRRLAQDMKRKPSIRKLRGQYQQQQSYG